MTGSCRLGSAYAAFSVTLLERLRSCQFRLHLGQFGFRRLLLTLQVSDRDEEIVPALARGLGECRIGEMVDVCDPRLALFRLDLHVELAGHALELRNHQIELAELPALLLDLESSSNEQGSHATS